MPSRRVGQPLHDALDTLGTFAPEDVAAGLAEVTGATRQVADEVEKERLPQELHRHLLEEAVGMLEQRLLRVENSVTFRLNRAIGYIVRTRILQLGSLAANWPFLDACLSRFLCREDAYSRWVRYQEAALADTELPTNRPLSRTSQPLISLLMHAQRNNREWFVQALGALRTQSYQNWQLCVCVDGSADAWTSEHVRLQATEDPRIIHTISTTTIGRAHALNEASALATGAFVGVLNQHDILHQHCLNFVAAECEKPNTQIVYTDHDHLSTKGRRIRPRFKPDWSPDLLLSCMYLGQLWVVHRATLLDRIGSVGQWFRLAHDRDPLYDLSLRITDHDTVTRHVPRVLYHKRSYGLQRSGGSGIRTVEDALRRRGIAGDVVEGPIPESFAIRRRPNRTELVSIVVCSRNLRLLERFVRCLRAKTTDDKIELVVVEHQAGPSPFPIRHLESLWQQPLVHVPYAREFNFAVMGNLGAAASRGDVLLFLNDDVEPLCKNWLRTIVSQAERPEVGVVGARLLYPSGAIQHAGIALGMSLDGAGHIGRFHFRSDLFPWLTLTRNVTAVTGACLAIRRCVFDQLGGLDPIFPFDYNDVDLCLRAREAGYLVVLEANAVLRHRESTTRAQVCQYRERAAFYHRWSALLRQPDPYVPIALERKTEDIRLP